MGKLANLTQNTMLPLGLAVSVIGGGAVWLTTLYWEQKAMAASIQRLSSTQIQYAEDIHTIKLDIAVIKNELIKRGR